ncbi:hypothetical protein K435DRAFT_791054 [Dendrothele bispora CBS 962.96]|uniref:Uncharacterized protein n=1 Tax=Dendrothele bispora (strain CBS 962.96) TaxID=1314807 RepID=A0A4S8MMZ9_DENBC|nr:hypothetical protein K435DRAFT_791054 [Dendrothele bispora CBS 962.96]
MNKTRSRQKKPAVNSQTSPSLDPQVSDSDSSPEEAPKDPGSTSVHPETVSPQHKRAYTHLIESDPGAYTPPPANKTLPRVSPISDPSPDSPGADSDSDSSSSSSSFNSSPVFVKMSAKAGESWTNNGPGKAPTVHSRFLKPQEYGSVKASFLRFLRKTKVSDVNSETARDHFFCCFQNEQTMNYFAAAHDKLMKLSAEKFENAMLEHLIGASWIESVRSLILDARQDSFEDGAFNIMYDTLVSYNNLLKGVGKAIDDSLFQSTLRSSLNRDFKSFLEAEGVDLSSSDLDAWNWRRSEFPSSILVAPTLLNLPR